MLHQVGVSFGMRICESVIRIVTRFKWFRTRTSYGLFQIMSEYMNSTIYMKFFDGTQIYNFFKKNYMLHFLNPLTYNDNYSGRTAPLTSMRCILYFYSTNIGTEYFKHGIDSSFFSLFKM